MKCENRPPKPSKTVKQTKDVVYLPQNLGYSAKPFEHHRSAAEQHSVVLEVLVE